MRYPIVYQSLGGATPLMYACQQSRENEVLDILMKQPQSVKDKDRTLKTPLHYCAENTNTKCAEAILQIGPQLVNAQDENGYSPLHLAVIAGNKPLIKLLIAKGADVNLYDNEGHSAVHWAIVSSEREALEMIIQAGADPSTPDIHGGYPLHYAVQMCGSNYQTSKSLCDAVKLVQKLLFHGVNVNVMDKDGRQPILWAASAGSALIIKDLISSGARVDAADKDGLTALHCAASRGHTETIEILVTSCGAEVDVIDGNGCSALFYAVTLGHADATAILLKLGAQPNRQDRKGRTPAHCGAAKGQLETLRILEKFGANLWIRNVKGDFPFHEAVASGRRDLVLWFLEKNPDAINIGNNDGRCPLHVAAMYNNVDMLKLLLKGKCLVNPVMRSSKGILMTPLNVALCKGHRSCAKILQLHGAVPYSKVSTSNVYYEETNSNPSEKAQLNRGFGYWEEQVISPSFTVIRTSIGDDAETPMQNEKKKVYRRRKKRKNLSNGKRFEKVESDSEDSDERMNVSAQEISVISKNIDDKNLKDEEEKMRKMGETTDAITSIILTDDHGRNTLADVQQSVTNKDGNLKTKPQEQVSAKDSRKKGTSLSPDSFPTGMLMISQLDSETTELDGELDGTKTPNESEALETNTNASGLQVSKNSDTGESKSSNLDDSTENTKANEKETENENKTNNFLSPSFTVLRDHSEEKSSQSSVLSSEDTKNESKSETEGKQKQIVIEKSTKITHSKTNSVKKYEKTTKSISKKEGKTESEDNLSSSSSRKSEKSTKSTKTKSISSDGKETKITKPQESEGATSITETKQRVETITITTDAEKEAEDNAKNEQRLSTDTEITNETSSVAAELENPTKSMDVKSEVDSKTEVVPQKPTDPHETKKIDSTDYIEVESPKSKEASMKEEVVVAEIHQSDFASDITGEKTEKNTSAPSTDNVVSDLKQENRPEQFEHDVESSKNLLSTKKEAEIKEFSEAKDDHAVPKSEALPVTETTQSAVESEKLISDENIITVSGEKEGKENNVEDPPSLRNTKSLPDINTLDSDLNVEQIESIGKDEVMSQLQLPEINVHTAPTAKQPRHDNDNNLVQREKENYDLGPVEPTDSASEKIQKKHIKPRSVNSDQTLITSDEAKRPKNDTRNNSPEKENAEKEGEITTSTDQTSDECEPSCLPEKTDNFCLDPAESRNIRTHRVSRLCRRNKELRETSQISVNQLVQGTIRKYHLERGIFHQLLELKRLQIRAGRANEQVLVKRLADEYERSCACLGMRHYTGTYKFKEFEKFLYDQLKILNRGHLILPEMKSYDDIDALSGILKKSRFKIVNDFGTYEPRCACLTQRCHHSTRAYTTLPCSAYVASIRRNKSHKQTRESFLPSIYECRTEREKYESRPTTLELIQGNKKQVIELPPTNPDKAKKYYITFTIKSAHNFKDDDFTENGRDSFKHRHAKSV